MFAAHGSVAAQAPPPAAHSGNASTAEDASVNRKTVLVVRPPAQDVARTDAFNRLWAELHIHGFEADAIDRELGDEPSALLTEWAAERSALAAFAFTRRDATLSLEVVLVDRTSGQTSPRRLAFVAGTSDAASLIAVRAVDLLRASLQDFPEPPNPPAAPEPEPESAPAEEMPLSAAAPEVARREHAWTLAAEGTLLWPGRHFSVGFGPAFGVLHRPVSWFQRGLRLGGAFGTSFDAQRGSASVQQGLGFLEARALIVETHGFSVAVLAGGGAFFLQASGTVQSPLTPQDDSVWSSVFTAGLHLEQSLGGDFALGLSGRALALVPALGVAVLGERERLQQPALQVSLGLSVGF
jgi:hypothetical protein